MEGFKKIIKMKTGGSVDKAIEAYEKRERKTEVSEDIAKDKAMIKKGVKQHEEKLHKDEPKTELKLKTGGRAKKEGGCVGRYKSGSGVSYGAKKTKEDKKEIAAIKRMKHGGKTKGYAGGGVITDEERARMPAGKLPQQIVDEEATKQNVETREMVAGPLRKLKQGVLETFKSKAKTPMKEGGSLKAVDAEENPGLAKLPTTVRNKMGYAKKGGKVC